MESRLAGLSHSIGASRPRSTGVRSYTRKPARRRSSAAVQSTAAAIISGFWRHYEDARLRSRTERILSTLIEHDDVWKLVRLDITRYLEMLGKGDGWPFSPNCITALKDAPYRKEAVELLTATLAVSGMARQEVQAALRAQLAKEPQ